MTTLLPVKRGAGNIGLLSRILRTADVSSEGRPPLDRPEKCPIQCGSGDLDEVVEPATRHSTDDSGCVLEGVLATVAEQLRP